MDKKETRIKNLEEKIKGLDTPSVISLIGSLREESPYKGLLPLLAGLHRATVDTGIKNEIERFFNDLKDQSFAEEVISIIENSGDTVTRNVLISSCWQSGIDYSPFLEYFTRWSLTGDYTTTLECYTAIEQFAYSVSPDTRAAEAKMISSALGTISDDKILLLKEIIKILEH